MNAALEKLVWKRAKGRCEYCQVEQKFDEMTFEIDHIRPQEHRGQTTPGNLALACFTCNKHKGTDLSGIDPTTNRIVRLFHPRRMKWHRHFRWDGPWLVGRTPIGRTTIATLAINSPLRVRLRNELMANGEFRPEAD